MKKEEERGLSYLQLYRGQLLLDIPWATVKDPHQGLLVEALNLILYRLNVVHLVAFRESELGDRRPGRDVVKE